MNKSYPMQFFADRLDRLLFAISCVVENMHSTGTDDNDEDCEVQPGGIAVDTC